MPRIRLAALFALAAALPFAAAAQISTSNPQFWLQDAAGIAIPAQDDAYFGSTLAAGDFDADGFDDLAVGVPYESVGTVANAGAFQVLFGSLGGLTTLGDRIFYLGNDMPGTPASGDHLAWSLAAGDFDPASPGDELAVGAPGTWISGLLGAGAVWIVADLGGLATADQLDLDTAGMPGDAHVFDAFGCALAAGQFDGTAGDDLAITACNRQVEGVDEAGSIFVSYFGVRPATELDQTALPQEQAETSDYFGLTLGSGDFDADGVDELVVGVAFEDVGGDESAGIAHILPGVRDSGLTKSGARTLRQVMSIDEPNDRFGQALVAGRWSGHSGMDLAIAAPSETYAGDNQAGAVHVFFSRALFVDGFESEGLGAWSAAVAGLF
jgi:hypothetical protein